MTTELRVEAPDSELETIRQLIAAGQHDQALARAEALLATYPKSAGLIHLQAVTLHLLGRSVQSLPLFEQAHALLHDQPHVYQNQAIALIAAGRLEEGLAAARRAVALRPNHIGSLANLALAQIRAGRLDAAGESLKAGLALEPGHPGLLTQAAHVALEQGRLSDAEALIDKALVVKPAQSDSLYVHAVLLQAQGRMAEAIKAYDRLQAANPGHQAGFANKGVALRETGRIREAIRHFRAGLARWPDFAVLRYNLAVTLLYSGDWRQGWPDYEYRLSVTGALERSPLPDSPLWTGEAIDDRHLLVIHEQGFGDTFQFLRFLPFAAGRARKVTFVCHARLKALLSRLDLFREGRIGLIADNQKLPDHDLHLPLLSLPGLAGATPETVPPAVMGIDIEPECVKRWATLAGSANASWRWRIGLSWQGNPAAAVDRGRSIPLAEMHPLGKLSGKADFISLQCHFGTDQIVPAGLELRVPGGDFDAGDDAFVDTAALMMSLDLVITSDTAIAHLAGLLGRPVWLLLKTVPDWRWGPEGHLSPWYPTMRLFRQREGRPWHELLAEAAADLDRLIMPPTQQATAAASRFSEAIERQSAGQFSQAAAIYGQALGARPRNAQLLNMLAMAVLEDGRRDPTSARLGLAYALHSNALKPATADFWSNSAVLLDALGSRDDSKRALAFALSVAPDHLASTIALAKKLSAEGRGSDALALIERARQKTDAPHLYSALATILNDLGRPDEAIAALRQALERDSGNARLWVQLGALQSAAGRTEEAMRSWETALVADPDNADAYSNLGVAERNKGEVELACFYQRRAVEIDPGHAEAWNNLGVTELEAGREGKSIDAFRRAIAIRPSYSDAHLALGMVLLNGGDFANGFRHYEGRLGTEKLGITAGMPNIPLWKGGDPNGLTFLLMAEQGFGDAFQFVRYATWLKLHGARKVLVGCRARIAHLIETVPGVDGVVVDGGQVPPVDVMAFMMSMPALTGMRLDTIPSHPSYMTADPVRVARWAEWLAQKPGYRVGIVWQGNPDPKVDKGRSFPLARLEPLARIPGIRLIALQKGAGEEQQAALGDRFIVEQPGEDFDSGPDAFADTAAMIMNLDLVVTSDTAVAHLAGALGRPCWVILKAQAEWRWLRARSDSPWYPMTRLFRRITDEDESAPFEGVVGRLAAALTRLVAGNLAERHVTAAETSVVTIPRDPVRIFRQAADARRNGDKDTAWHLFASLLDTAAVAPAALHMLGAMALIDDRPHQALLLLAGAERAGLKSPELATNVAITLRRLGRLTDARRRLEALIAESPTSEAHLSLANILREQGDYDQALAQYETSIALNPAQAKAHRGLGNLLRDMHRPGPALSAFEAARALDPNDAELVLDHAHAKLYSGDLAGGFADYEIRWKSREMVPRPLGVPRWRGEAAPGKTLLIHGEQGFGDNIQFARFIDLATERVGHVIVEVRQPLVALFAHLRTRVPVEIVEMDRVGQDYDLEIPMMSLPHALGTTLATLPAPAIFAVEPDAVAPWRARFAGNGIKVGLVWQGNPKARADQGRSPPLKALEPLLADSRLRFVALQKSDGLEQVAGSAFAGRIDLPGEALGDFYQTAAAISALDLVVSSCTATLHLAASLSVPVFGMLKYNADWRWIHGRSDSPWYPTLRLFQQQSFGDWDGVVQSVSAAIKDMAR